MKISFICICLASMFSCSSQPEVKEEPEWIVKKGWKAENNDYYFIQYPMEWELIDDELNPENGFKLVSPKTFDTDSIRESITLNRQFVRKGVKLDYFGAKSVENNQFHYSNDYKLHSRKLVSEGNEYYRIDATVKVDGIQIRGIQYIMIERRSAFILSLFCTPTTFDDYQNIGEEIMRTFIPKKKFWINDVKPYF